MIFCWFLALFLASFLMIFDHFCIIFSKLVFVSFFEWIFINFGALWNLKTMVFPKEKQGFSQNQGLTKSLILGWFFWSFWHRFWCIFPYFSRFFRCRFLHQFWDGFWINFGGFWAPFWEHLGAILAPLAQISVNFGSLSAIKARPWRSDRFLEASGHHFISFWEHFGFILVEIWNILGTFLVPIWKNKTKQRQMLATICHMSLFPSPC